MQLHTETVTVHCPKCEADVSVKVSVGPTGVEYMGRSERCVEDVEVVERDCQCEWTDDDLLYVENDAIAGAGNE